MCVTSLPVPQVYTVGASGVRLLMWATGGNHGDQWTYASVVLSNPAPFRVTFQAQVGADTRTDVSLDDITYTPGCIMGGMTSRTHLHQGRCDITYAPGCIMGGVTSHTSHGASCVCMTSHTHTHTPECIMGGTTSSPIPGVPPPYQGSSGTRDWLNLTNDC